MSATIFISTPSLTISVVIENLRYILNIINFLPKLRLIENLRSTVKSLTGYLAPKTTMSTFSLNSSSDSTTLAVPKLHDDGSNWSDYEPRIRKAMGLIALWRHVEGIVVAPKPYTLKEGVHVLADGTTPAMDDQIESKESKIIEFEKWEYLAQHIILLMVSTRL